MTSQDPGKITAACQPWLPDGSPEPYLTRGQAATRYLTEPDDELPEPEWDSADSNRYQDQIEAAGHEAARRAGHQSADPADRALDMARSIPYTLTAKAEALLDAEASTEDEPEAGT